MLHLRRSFWQALLGGYSAANSRECVSLYNYLPKESDLVKLHQRLLDGWNALSRSSEIYCASFGPRGLLPTSSTFAKQVSKQSRFLKSSDLSARHFTVSRALGKRLDDTELQRNYVYDQSIALTDDLLLQTVRRETARTWPKAEQLIDEMQGKFLSFLVQTTQAERVLEIGCFTGYSALCLASGLDSSGSLVTCDIDADTMLFAKKFFGQSSHASQITAVTQDGLKYLSTLPHHLQFDFIFIDANKRKYRDYYDFILKHNLLHPLGLLVFDNTLFRGRVAAYAAEISSTTGRIARSLAEFNAYVAQDLRTSQVIMPLWDGLTLVRLARKD